jgi:hypothetical protein
MALRRQLAADIVRSLGEDSQFVVAPSCGIRQRHEELPDGIEHLFAPMYRHLNNTNIR